jgi:hypothetical protein
MSRSTGRMLVTVTLLSLSFASGCRSASPPESEPTPDPGPHYQPVSAEFCRHVRVDDIAERFHLSVPSWFDPSGRLFESEYFTRMMCPFRAVAVDDRFATEEDRFTPIGGMDIETFPERAGAQLEHESGAHNFELDRESGNATVASVEGWWEEGLSRAYAEEEELLEDDGGSVYRADVTYDVYRANVHIEASLRAYPYSRDIAEVTQILHELVRALLDEAVSHLTLTE